MNAKSGPTWRLSPLQFEDFVITPDSARIVAAALITRRTPVEGKLKPATSASPDGPDGPIHAGPTDTFVPMDRQLVVLNLTTRVVEA